MCFSSNTKYCVQRNMLNTCTCVYVTVLPMLVSYMFVIVSAREWRWSFLSPETQEYTGDLILLLQRLLQFTYMYLYIFCVGQAHSRCVTLLPPPSPPSRYTQLLADLEQIGWERVLHISADFTHIKIRTQLVIPSQLYCVGTEGCRYNCRILFSGGGLAFS